MPALTPEQEMPTEKPDWWKEMLAAVMRELPRNMGRWNDGNAPGHCHDVPGIWNSDNSAKAGTTCAWCLVWNKAKEELDAAASVPVQTETKESALHALVDQAQELDMGYGPSVAAQGVPSVPAPDYGASINAPYLSTAKTQKYSISSGTVHGDIIFRPGPDEVRISQTGMTHRGEKVEDAGQMYRTLMAVMHGGTPDPADACAALQQPVQAGTDKILSIIASAYQIAGWHDAPEHILDVLSDPEAATMDQIEAMLPYQPGLVQAVPDDSEILLAAMRRAVLPLAHAANAIQFYRPGYFDLDAAIAAAVARRSGAPGEPGQ